MVGQIRAYRVHLCADCQFTRALRAFRFASNCLATGGVMHVLYIKFILKKGLHVFVVETKITFSLFQSLISNRQNSQSQVYLTYTRIARLKKGDVLLHQKQLSLKNNAPVLVHNWSSKTLTNEQMQLLQMIHKPDTSKRPTFSLLGAPLYGRAS